MRDEHFLQEGAPNPLRQLPISWQGSPSPKRDIWLVFEFHLKKIDAQRIGRMGELVVELELLARGWLVGNFNSSIKNSAGWDIFATKGSRSVKVRVKSKRPGTSSFVWSQQRGGLVFDLAEDDDADFVAAVSFEIGAMPAVYILPSQRVESDLLASAAAWLAAPKRDGSPRKPTSALRVHLDDRVAVTGHGYAKNGQSTEVLGKASRLIHKQTAADKDLCSKVSLVSIVADIISGLVAEIRS